MNLFIYEIYELDEKGNKYSLVAEDNTRAASDKSLRYLKKNNPGAAFKVEKLVLF